MKDTAKPVRADMAAIYAGGSGARLGGVDKATLEIGGEALWRRVATRLAPQADSISVLSPERPNWTERLEGARWLPDVETGARAGPAAGLAAALQDLLSRAGPSARLLTAPVDAPFAPHDLFAKLEAARQSAGARAAIVQHEGGRHPVFGVWQADCASDVIAALAAGERALHRLAGRVGAVVCEGWAGAAPDPFLNINTPEDIAAAEAAIRYLDTGTG